MRQRVLALVAEQTGYPEDMLDLDLDLEADLGVDTVKQAELFATVREIYGIAREDTLQAARLPHPQPRHRLRPRPRRRRSADETAGSRRPRACPGRARPDRAPAAPVAVAVSEDEVRQRVLALVAEQTGYPEDMLDLDLDLEADLGVDTVKQAELFATVREVYGIAREDTLQAARLPHPQPRHRLRPRPRRRRSSRRAPAAADPRRAPPDLRRPSRRRQPGGSLRPGPVRPGPPPSSHGCAPPAAGALSPDRRDPGGRQPGGRDARPRRRR